MKKLLLALTAAAALTASAQAPALDKSASLQALAGTGAPAMAPSRADDGYTIRYCGNIDTWTSLQAAGTYMQYITIPADVATQLAGNKLTSISYSICLSATDGTITKEGKVFVTENPYVETVDELVFETEAATKIRNSYKVSPGYQTATFPDDQQYEIKENTPFSFGVIYDCAATEYPVGYDGQAANQFAGFVNFYQGGELAGYFDMQYSLGSNLMMYAVTKGEKTQVLDLGAVLSCSIDSYTLPVVTSADALPLNVALSNLGGNALTSMEYTITTSDGASSTNTLDLNIASGKQVWLEIPTGTLPVGHSKLTFVANKFNGKEIAPFEWPVAYINLGAEAGYDRKFVVEEGTGTWCGWCPRGIVGMDYMQENYPEKFVGIAVHADDKFEVNNYGPFINKFFSSFPTCVINRDPAFSGDPGSDYLAAAYNWWLNQKSPAEIALEYEVVDKNLEVKANATFAIDDNHAYNMAIVLTEDGLTGYQTNNYAGGGQGKMGGWESKTSKVSWTYTHTAININDAFGVELAPAVEAGKTYESAATFAYIGAMNRKLFNINNTHAIALLFDAETGVILNAAKIELEEQLDGIDDALAQPASPAEYYNIQGQKVANPQPGKLYIRLQDGQATKVMY